MSKETPRLALAPTLSGTRAGGEAEIIPAAPKPQAPWHARPAAFATPEDRRALHAGLAEIALIKASMERSLARIGEIADDIEARLNCKDAGQ